MMFSVIWAVIVLAIVAGGILYLYRNQKPIVLRGAITMESSDIRKEVPIADAAVAAITSLGTVNTKSDSSGFFSVTLPPGVRRGQAVSFRLRHAGYAPLDVHEFVGDKLYVEHMEPMAPSHTTASGSRITISNLLVRYSIKTMTVINVGSSVKTFQIANTGNIPCKGRHPCSPDGKWKATIGSASLDAGPGNQFQNARASCIAGPCPFTKIEGEVLSNDGEQFQVTARDWSGSTTFLMEAEVFKPMVSQIVHQSYPVIFGQALTFTLPSSAEGVIIQADINGESIIFPLGPVLFLTWADCTATVNPDQTKVYRCELRPGYQFGAQHD
jgi:hypothetical protein